MNVNIEIVSGVEGNSLYINDYRVAGPKPWGGGRVIASIPNVESHYLIEDLKRFVKDLEESEEEA